ncbi:major facilitator superfamily domain-containing protein 3 isoform X2 [Latimeria chalumnae]|uniref:major facilitator superfamily domain-containing protein 3 isoform X2 n=1 Tax=Latimeria chalumnae TaxID=7897 RepID=UPI0003C16517
MIVKEQISSSASRVWYTGEHGAIGMFPLFLLDHGLSAKELGFWTGIVAVSCSIVGSSVGGILMSKYRALSLIRTVFFMQLGSMSFQTFLVLVFDDKLWLTRGAALLSISLQHFLGGLITTLTFSIMMHCTQKADEGIQATHYSFLATVEVLGKLAFGTLVGSVVDWIGFPCSFFFFLILSFTAVLHISKAPAIGR